MRLVCSLLSDTCAAAPSLVVLLLELLAVVLRPSPRVTGSELNGCYTCRFSVRADSADVAERVGGRTGRQAGRQASERAKSTKGEDNGTVKCLQMLRASDGIANSMGSCRFPPRFPTHSMFSFGCLFLFTNVTYATPLSVSRLRTEFDLRKHCRETCSKMLHT